MTNPIPTTNESTQSGLDAAALAYKNQSDIVAKLRAEDCESNQLKEEEVKLRELKRSLDQARKSHQQATGTSIDTSAFNRDGTEDLLRRRFFIAPSFEIYGGVKGLYDYGPPGCAVKNNLLAMWRQHFIVEEGMLELEATCLTPAPVLKASGHVDKFSDLMVKDQVTNDCYRADHLLQDHLNTLLEDESLTEEQKNELIGLRERVDDLSQEEMDEMFAKYNVVAPETKNPLTPAYPFNLMFSTSIGPSGLMPGYLRPETAQGIFVNFKRLLEYMGGKLPFACAQIGLSFRNEISPKSGLLRVREFQQAEIEHFVNGDDKSHPKYNSIRDVEINMYGRPQQLSAPYEPIKTSIGQAVSEGIIGNETVAYFIGRTSELMKAIGMNMNYVRFRQHMEHEMAHYASDCWDLEVKCSYGWVECAGLADRSAYDLGNHSNKSGYELTARENYAETRIEKILTATPNKGMLGRTFRRDAQSIMKGLEELNEEGIKKLEEEMNKNGKANINGFDITCEHVSFKTEEKKVTGRAFYPGVIEPSFGIGRILACLWEHSYYIRDGEDEGDGSAIRAVLKLPAQIAPIKCGVLPLSKNESFNEMIDKLRIELSNRGLINRVDDSGQSIGRRYARGDEIGTPFGITVDFDSLQDGSVTVRERDSTKQIRCQANEAVDTIDKIVKGELSWEEVMKMFPVFTSN